MRTRWLLGLGLVLSLLVASPSSAARFTTRLDALAALLDVRNADPAVTGKVKKAVGKAVKKLAKDTTSLAAEVKTALQVIGGLEKAAASDAEIQAAALAAVQGLAADVAAAVNAAQMEVDAARTKERTIQFDKLDRKLDAARQLVIALPGTTGLKARLQLLFKTMVKVLQVTRVLDSGGGGGGGGGGNACGPSSPVPGIRALRAGEQVTGSVTEFGMAPYVFAARSVTAKSGPLFGNQGAPVVLDFEAFDCDRQSSWTIRFPYPPMTGVDYFGGVTPGLDAGYRADWDGLMQVFPGVNATKIRIDSFNAGTKSVSGHLTINGFVSDLAFTIEDWDGN